MKITIARSEGSGPPSFSYWSSPELAPHGHGPWALMDTADWSLEFPDGRRIGYGSLERIHQDLGQAMFACGVPRTAVTRRKDLSALTDVTDPKAQWEQVRRELMVLILRAGGPGTQEAAPEKTP